MFYSFLSLYTDEVNDTAQGSLLYKIADLWLEPKAVTPLSGKGMAATPGHKARISRCIVG